MNYKLILSVIALAGLSGCASAPSGSHEEISRLEVPLTKYPTVSISVNTNLNEAKDAANKLEKAIADELTKSFKSISFADKEKSSVQLRLKIIDFRSVGKGSRFLAGTMAGQDRVVVEAELYDNSQRRIVGAFKAKGENVVGGRFWETGVDAAISEVAKEVTKYLKARN